MKGLLKIYFLLFIFFIFSTYNTQHNKENFSIIFPIKEILIENNIVTNLSEIKSDFNFLINTSLLFLNEERVLAVIKKHDFISTIQFKKNIQILSKLK